MQQNYYTPPQAPPMFTSAQMRQMAHTNLRGKWKKAIPIFTVYLLIAQLPAIILALTGNSTMITLTPEMFTGEVLPTLPKLSWIGTVYSFLTAGALAVSISTLSLNIIRDEYFSMSTLASGFKRFGQSFRTYLLYIIYSFLWAMIFMLAPMLVMTGGMLAGANFVTALGIGMMFGCSIGAAIFVLRYQLAYYVATDNPGMKAAYALANSSKLMRGNKMKFILLSLSFIGWMILAAIPEGICQMFFSKYMVGGNIGMLILAIVTMLISAVAAGALGAYTHTALAVFYSSASGFFRTKEQYAPDPEPYTTLTPENIQDEINNMARK